MSKDTSLVSIRPISSTEVSVLVCTEYAQSLHEYLRSVGVVVTPNEEAIFHPYTFVRRDGRIIRHDEPLDYYFEATCSPQEMQQHLSAWFST